MGNVSDRFRQGAQALLHRFPRAVVTPTFSVAVSLPLPFSMPLIERRGERLALRPQPARATLQLSVCREARRRPQPAARPSDAGRARLRAKPVVLRRLPPDRERLPEVGPRPLRPQPYLPGRAAALPGRAAPLPRLSRVTARCRAVLAAWLVR